MFGKKMLVLVAGALALLAVPWGSAQAGPYYWGRRPYYRPYFYGPRVGVGIYVAPPPVVVAPAAVVVPAPIPVVVAPPAVAVPKRLPLLSTIRPATGLEPLAPSNDARVVIAWVPFWTSKMLPSPFAPPLWVVPNRLPVLSMTSVHCGEEPLVPANDAKAVRA